MSRSSASFLMFDQAEKTELPVGVMGYWLKRSAKFLSTGSSRETPGSV